MKPPLSNIFKGVGNQDWDLARILSSIGFLAVITLAAFQVYTMQPVSLHDLSGSLRDILIGSGLIIAAKDVAVAHATNLSSQN